VGSSRGRRARCPRPDSVSGSVARPGELPAAAPRRWRQPRGPGGSSRAPPGLQRGRSTAPLPSPDHVPCGSKLRGPGAPAPRSIRCRAPRFGLPPTFASLAPDPGPGSAGVHQTMSRLIGHPFAPLGFLAGGEGFALAPNAGLFVVLTLLELREEAGFLALLLAALERALERFVGLDDDLGHTAPPQDSYTVG